MKADDVKELKELRAENDQLKKLLGEAQLDKAMLKYAAEKNMVTLGRRRDVVDDLQYEFGVSQRRACRITGQHRSVQRHRPKPPPADKDKIGEWLRMFAKRRPRWGWRRAAELWQFDSLLEAQVLIENWRNNYSINRPHLSTTNKHPTSSTWTDNQDPLTRTKRSISVPYRE